MPNDTDQPTLAVLKPCPFCGNGMEDRGYGLMHTDGAACILAGYAFDPLAWNTRTTHEPRPAGDLREALERLRDIADQREEGVQREVAHRQRSGDYNYQPDRKWATVSGVRLDDLQTLLALATHSPAPMAGEVGRLRTVSRAIHEHLCRRDIMQYLDNEEDCEGLAHSVLAALAAHPSTQEGGE